MLWCNSQCFKIILETLYTFVLHFPIVKIKKFPRCAHEQGRLIECYWCSWHQQITIVLILYPWFFVCLGFVFGVCFGVFFFPPCVYVFTLLFLDVRLQVPRELTSRRHCLFVNPWNSGWKAFYSCSPHLQLTRGQAQAPPILTNQISQDKSQQQPSPHWKPPGQVPVYQHLAFWREKTEWAMQHEQVAHDFVSSLKYIAEIQHFFLHLTEALSLTFPSRLQLGWQMFSQRVTPFASCAEDCQLTYFVTTLNSLQIFNRVKMWDLGTIYK